jgi:cytochrome oxidase Cu insertion factor (SCO1/SenC/PrrC family)
MLLIACVLMMLVSPRALFAQAALGPVDGSDLPPYDLNRVVAGSMAPDFRLQDENGKVHQLSQYRGKNVVLVMYRGFW